MSLALVLDTFDEVAERALWGSEPGDLGLMRVMAGIERSACHANQYHVGTLYDLSRDVRPRVVVAMGSVSAAALLPGFRDMRRDHGRPLLGHGGTYVVMATYHPVGAEGEALGALAADLGKIELLMLDGLVELMQPAPVAPEWPDMVGFLAFDGVRKSAKCLLCGKADTAAYVGEGLTWRLCRAHAAQSAQWAKVNLAELRYHAEVARRDAARGKAERAVDKVQAALVAGNQRRIDSEAR